MIVGLNTGGAEAMLKRLIESSMAQGDFEHAVLSLTDIGTIGLQLREAGVDVQALGMHHASQAPWFLWRLVRLIRASRPTIVQTWMYHADLLGGVAARLAGCRNVIWGIRTISLATGATSPTACVRAICAALSSFLPRLVVCVASRARDAHIAIGYDPRRMVVVPNGFDMDKLVATPAQSAAVRAACGWDASLLIVGCVGRFHTDKDQRNFVLAAAMLAQRLENVRFLMVGRGVDTSNSELRQWIKRTGFEQLFALLGERGDVPSCLAAMDIYCLPSRTEGCPNVVGEAMAMGVPCVVTDVGDAAMLVGQSGVIVPKEDAGALARGMEQLAGMGNDARRRLGALGRARIQSEFSMTLARSRFEALYRSLLVKEQG